MRLWSIHPSYLDSIGLVTLWRESLLAKKVPEGKTKRYIHHPQLVRFRITKYPVATINYYLLKIYEEAETKGLSFDRKKIQ
ncbi:MAG: pyrimidine dimer DNA glycosylase/endonuclease V [Bacteroidales bacterium]